MPSVGELELTFLFEFDKDDGETCSSSGEHRPDDEVA